MGEYLNDKLQDVAGKLRQLHREEIHPILLESCWYLSDGWLKLEAHTGVLISP